MGQHAQMRLWFGASSQRLLLWPVVLMVAQVYGGLTYMDFSKEGLPAITRLPPSLLPPMHLIYRQQPKSSHRVGCLWHAPSTHRGCL